MWMISKQKKSPLQGKGLEEQVWWDDTMDVLELETRQNRLINTTQPRIGKLKSHC